MFENLPVLIVEKWSDVNQELLNNTIIDFKKKHIDGFYNYNKLTLKYWTDQINQFNIVEPTNILDNSENTTDNIIHDILNNLINTITD
jgi:hypothetical protein